MPKEKGSPKTGGRKPIGEEERVLFQCRCTPQKREYLKKCSQDYDSIMNKIKEL